MRTSAYMTLALVASCCQLASAKGTLGVLERLASADPKPFVIVEGSGKRAKNRAQGVVISPRGHVLSAGHIAWIEEEKSFTDRFRISFRGTGKELPDGVAHIHKTVFKDREDTAFFEHYFAAELQKNGDSRFVAGGDLAVFRTKVRGPFPKLDFFSGTKPDVATEDVLYLCHYNFPHKSGDPFLLINPVEVVGVAQTSSGLQYLAKGYYRVGSSGGALLKDGRLIGIQSSAYTINAKGIGEVPLGLISFHLVWRDLFEGVLPPQEDDTGAGTEDRATGTE